MVVHNNPSPWVFLAMIVLAGAIVLGILINDTELVNPTRVQQVQKTEQAAQLNGVWRTLKRTMPHTVSE